MLTNENLHMCMRMALTPFSPDLKSWQDKLELSSVTEQQKVGGVAFRRERERNCQTVQLLRCVEMDML